MSPTPESEPTGNRSHPVRERLGAAPPQWKIDDVKKMAETSTVTDGSITLGVAGQYIVD